MSNFEVGDKVVDKTAARNGWPDVYGTVIEDDGSNVKVKYESGNERWKMWINLEYRALNETLKIWRRAIVRARKAALLRKLYEDEPTTAREDSRDSGGGDTTKEEE